MRKCSAVTVVAVVMAACGPSERPRVTTLQLGRSLNPDDSVSAHTTRFKPDDTVYVSILSDEPGYGTITVRWRLHGQLVSEATREVPYTRAAATEFHLQNSGGFPPGSYRVDVLIDGEPVGSREFFRPGHPPYCGSVRQNGTDALSYTEISATADRSA